MIFMINLRFINIHKSRCILVSTMTVEFEIVEKLMVNIIIIFHALTVMLMSLITFIICPKYYKYLAEILLSYLKRCIQFCLTYRV